MKPLISIIIPTFNRPELLNRALNSVFEQSYENWELIVVDDGSRDSLFSSLKGSDSPNPFYLIRTKNKGVSVARNLGSRLANGEWLAFLDSDDEWLPNKLEAQMELADENKSIPLIHGEEIWYRNGKRVNPKKKHKKQGGFIYPSCLPLCCISPSTSIIKKDVFFELGGFREDFPVCEDYDLWLKICSKYEVGFVETPIINKYGGHEDQLSQKYKAMDYWRVIALLERYEQGDLDEEYKQMTKEMIIEKSNILIAGYKKHKNLKNLDEIEQILRSLQSK